MAKKNDSAITLTSRYIVPFVFDKSVIHFDNLSNNTNCWEIESVNKQERDLYHYIIDSFITAEHENLTSPSAAIACMYQYKQLKPNFELLYKNEETLYRFYIRNLHLILFQNGIGLLWYTPDLKSSFQTLDDALDFTYHFKELARSESTNHIFIETIADYQEGLDVPETAILPGRKKYKLVNSFSMGAWIADILHSLNCKISFYPFREHGESRQQLPDKAILFHHGVLKENSALVRQAYYLTRGYKASYKITEDAGQQMFHPFDNLYCFATSEGCGYYAYADESNKAFFSDPTKIINDYFLLYILSLYQSYSLLLYSEKISKNLSANCEDYKAYSAEIIETLNDITTELNVFLAKSVYSSVSYIQHQNDFYEYITQKLRISQNIASVSAGIEALKNLEMHLEAEETAKKNQSLEAGITLISLLAIFSAFVDANDFVQNYLWHMFDLSQPIEVWIVNALVLGITMVVVFLCFRFIKMHFRSWLTHNKAKGASH